MRANALLILLLAIVLPGVLLAPVWPLAGLGVGEDEILYYLPSRVFLHDTIQSGEWPWMNPMTGADRAYAADPQSALWYPPTWLYVLLDPVLANGVVLWLHFSVALLGMYRLLRSERLRRQAAVFGAILFAFSGFMLAHRVHLTMLCSAAWR